MYNRLDTIPACDRQTDGQTDKQTDSLPRHSPRYAYATRGKNAVCTVCEVNFTCEQLILLSHTT